MSFSLEQIRGLIVDANGLPGVLRAMDSSDPETQRAAVGTLINVSINKRHKTLIRQQGGFDAILRCLNSSDSETIRYTLRALYNITLDEQNTLHVCLCGGSFFVHSMMHLHGCLSKRPFLPWEGAFLMVTIPLSSLELQLVAGVEWSVHILLLGRYIHMHPRDTQRW